MIIASWLSNPFYHVSHEDAMEHATKEYRKYKQRTISDVEHDYLMSIKNIEDLGKKGSKDFDNK